MDHSIDFTFQARYFTLGNRDKPKQIWFALHGYGQLANYFMRKFSVLADHDVLVIVPEALSKFYLQETEERMRTGNTRVGASWMTREDRLRDIRNYLSFLNSVYELEKPGVDIPVTVLGFSQGAATATRWVLAGHVRFSRLILWAGILPPDIDFNTGKEILKGKETFMVHGTEDPFLNDSRFAEMNMLAEKLGINPVQISFDGKHDIDTKTLLRFL